MLHFLKKSIYLIIRNLEIVNEVRSDTKKTDHGPIMIFTQLPKTTDQKYCISDESRYVTEVNRSVMLKEKSLGVLVSLIIIASAGNLQLVTSSGNDFTVADVYIETTISRIAFGSCR